MAIDPESPPLLDFNAHLHPTAPPEYQGTIDRIEAHTDITVPTDIDALRAQYDAAGIDEAAVSSSFFMGHGDVDRVRAANDALLDETDGVDGYHPLAAIPTAAGGDAAAAEFERCLDAGFAGGGVKTESGGIQMHDSELDPVLEVANDWGAPILVKPRIHDSLHPDAFDDRWQLNGVFGRETALAASIYAVINAGILDRYPDLHLVYHHAGGNIASMLDRIRLKLADRSWTRTEAETTFDDFRAQLAERVFVDTAGYDGSPAVVRRALEVFPSDKLLFGTDFPHETLGPETFARVVEGITSVTSVPDARGILGANARSLLGT